MPGVWAAGTLVPAERRHGCAGRRIAAHARGVVDGACIEVGLGHAVGAGADERLAGGEGRGLERAAREARQQRVADGDVGQGDVAVVRGGDRVVERLAGGREGGLGRNLGEVDVGRLVGGHALVGARAHGLAGGTTATCARGVVDGACIEVGLGHAVGAGADERLAGGEGRGLERAAREARQQRVADGDVGQGDVAVVRGGDRVVERLAGGREGGLGRNLGEVDVACLGDGHAGLRGLLDGHVGRIERRGGGGVVDAARVEVGLADEVGAAARQALARRKRGRLDGQAHQGAKQRIADLDVGQGHVAAVGGDQGVRHGLAGRRDRGRVGGLGQIEQHGLGGGDAGARRARHGCAGRRIAARARGVVDGACIEVGLGHAVGAGADERLAGGEGRGLERAAREARQQRVADGDVGQGDVAVVRGGDRVVERLAGGREGGLGRNLGEVDVGRLVGGHALIGARAHGLAGGTTATCARGVVDGACIEVGLGHAVGAGADERLAGGEGRGLERAAREARQQRVADGDVGQGDVAVVRGGDRVVERLAGGREGRLGRDLGEVDVAGPGDGHAGLRGLLDGHVGRIERRGGGGVVDAARVEVGLA